MSLNRIDKDMIDQNFVTEIIESTGYGVIGGLTVSAQATPNMTVSVASGTVHTPDGKRFTPTANSSLAITNSDLTKPRTDIVYVDTSGDISYLASELGIAAVSGKRDYTIATNTVGVIAGSNTYTIDTNFAENDTVVFDGITFTAVLTGATGDQFNVGVDTTESATNLATAINGNATINAKYDTTSSTNVVTITEKTAGSGNTPGTMTTTGTGVISTGTATSSKSADTVTFEGVVFTAVSSGATGNQFNIGLDTTETATNIATALNANTSINDKYTATSSTNIITLTEIVAGGGNTPISATTTGTVAITSGTATTSTAQIFPPAPSTPAGGVLLAEVKVGAGVTAITNANIKDLRLIKQNNNQIAEQLAHVAINFKAFGVKGDNIADDTLALQSVIDFANTNGLKLEFPNNKATYKVTGSLMLYPGMKIHGNGSKINAQPAVIGYGLNGGGNGVFTANRNQGALHDITIDGFTILVNRHTYHGVYLFSPNGMSDLTLTNLKIINPSWDGILCHGSSSYSSGNSEPYLEANPSNRRYRVENVVCINENITMKTRTGIMIEHVHDGIIKNCYVKGFHTGFHCEGSSDISFINCVGEDNCNDNQEVADYAGDFMIGRSEAVTMSNCRSRKISASAPGYPGIIRHRGLCIPNKFMKGFAVIGCSFIDGDIWGNEASIDTLTTGIGISFSDCIFTNCNITLTRQTVGQFREGVSFSNNTLYKSTINLEFINGFSIVGNTFINPSRNSLGITGCFYGNITANTFKGGDTANGTEWRKSQIIISTGTHHTINGNTFLINSTYPGKYCIGLYSTHFHTINGNSFHKNGSFGVYETYLSSTPAKNCMVSNNVFEYIGASSEKGILLNDASCIKVNNIVVETV